MSVAPVPAVAATIHPRRTGLSLSVGRRGEMAAPVPLLAVAAKPRTAVLWMSVGGWVK